MRWKKLAANVLRTNLGDLADPYKALLVVTKSCHSRCLNCNIWQAKVENELSLAEITRIAENNPFLQWLNITGGEPTERADLAQIVAAFVQHCPDLIFVNFATNGLNPDRVEAACARIRELGAPRFVVTVSIDGPPDVNDRLRGIPGDFRRAAETFSRLRKRGIEVFAGLTLYPENFRLLDQTVAALREAVGSFSPRELHVNLAHRSSHYFGTGAAPAPPPAEVAEVLAAHLRARGIPWRPFEWVERAYLRKAKRFLATGRTPVPCSALSSSVYISEQGIVHPCSIWEKPLGSLRENNYELRPILRAAAAVREQVKAKACPNCWTPCEAYPSLAASLWPGK